MAISPPASGARARPITDADLDRMIAIDEVHSGYRRRRFFEKRFASAKRHPEDFVQVGIEVDRSLCGFAIGRVLRGEFGQNDEIAVLDAIGVDPACPEQHLGQSLIDELLNISRRQGVKTLQLQVHWNSHDLLRFFNMSGFQLSPRLALERQIGELREEVDQDS
jgi:ribosomal protein S18 acetylase RimI-like enzyme